MYKSPPSCAPHLRTSPFHLPRLVRVSLDKFIVIIIIVILAVIIIFIT